MRCARSTLLASCLSLLAGFGCACSGADDPAADSGVADDGGSADRAPAAAPISAAELREACARTTACGVRPYPNLGSCVAAYRQLHVPQGVGPIYDALYRCVNAARGDCAAIAGCHGKRETCDQGYQASCAGTLASSCDLIDKRTYALDCAAAGLLCALKSDQRFTAACTRGSCDMGYGDRCSGNVHLTCAASVIETRDCTLDGLVCVSTTKQGAGCAGNDKVPCQEGSVTPFCEGSVAVSCEFVRVHRRDCAAEGLSCAQGKCQGAAAQLCDGTKPDRCDGGKLEACVGDAWETVDCAGLGLGACATENYARCTPPA